MWLHILIVLHLLASDIQLPSDFNERLTAITGNNLPQVELLPQARPTLIDVPRVAAAPVKDAQAAKLAAQAKRAIVIDADSGAVLYSKNADEPAAMASIAKLMVALVTLEEMESLDQVITVPKEILELEEASTLVGFTPGEKVRVSELLVGLLIASGNDAALTLAHGLAGDEAGFVELMNAKAERLGLSGTHFVNSTGLDAKGHQSTAREVAYLLIEAGKVQRLRDLSQRANATVTTESGSAYYVSSTDKLLGQTDLDVLLAKTGTTDEAGAAFTLLAERDGQRIAVVILDSPDRFTEAEHLVKAALDAFRWPDALAGTDANGEEDSAFGG